MLMIGGLDLPDQLRLDAAAHRPSPGGAAARHHGQPGITGRSACGTVTNLAEAGYVVKRDGRVSPERAAGNDRGHLDRIGGTCRARRDRVSLPENMKRSMSRQAEAERERRARIITADGEYRASKRLAAATNVMARDPAVLQLRLLQTVIEVASERNSTLIMPVPVELLRFLRQNDARRARCRAFAVARGLRRRRSSQGRGHPSRAAHPQPYRLTPYRRRRHPASRFPRSPRTGSKPNGRRRRLQGSARPPAGRQRGIASTGVPESGSGSPAARLAAPGITLPKVAVPLADRLPAERAGGYVYTSGQLPFVDGTPLATGKVGARGRRRGNQGLRADLALTRWQQLSPKRLAKPSSPTPGNLRSSCTSGRPERRRGKRDTGRDAHGLPAGHRGPAD
jgi:hypothetical protein